MDNDEFWNLVDRLHKEYGVPFSKGRWNCMDYKYQIRVFKYLAKWYAYSNQPKEASQLAKKLAKEAKKRYKVALKKEQGYLKRDIAQATDDFNRMWLEFCLYEKMPPKRKKQHVPCVSKRK